MTMFEVVPFDLARLPKSFTEAGDTIDQWLAGFIYRQPLSCWAPFRRLDLHYGNLTIEEMEKNGEVYPQKYETGNRPDDHPGFHPGLSCFLSNVILDRE